MASEHPGSVTAQGDASGYVDIQECLNFVWVLLCTFLVLTMQFGFAMLEVGSCRKAHRMTVLTKNIMDSAVSCVAFWVHCCWGSPPSFVADEAGMIQIHLVLFHFAFCATSVTICSGAMAERTDMLAYISYSAVMAGWIYPVVANAAWGDGDSLLAGEFQGRLHAGYRYHDLAGSGVVHLVGGCSAIVGNALLGRRIMRPVPSFEEPTAEGGLPRADQARLRRDHHGPAPAHPQTNNPAEDSEGDERGECEACEEPCRCPEGGWPRRFDSPERDREEFSGVHYLQAMGMFTLWVGWHGFNAGSIQNLDRVGGHMAAGVAWNSTLAASGGGLGSALSLYLLQRNLDITHLCNGVLSGLVAITAGCDVATEVGSFIIGMFAGLLIFPGSNYLLQRFKMDDPPSAIAVHAFCGLFGVLATGLCIPDCAGLASVGGGTPEQARLCAPGHDVRLQLAAQAWGALTLIWWTASISLVLWSIFAISEISRSREAAELEEIDAHLEALLAVGLPEAQVSDPLRAECVSACSLTVRRLMEEHGWRRTRFHEPADLAGLRTKLRRFREQSVETALESHRWPLLRGIAWLVRCLPCVRSLALLRLRIAPTAELSGLGHANINGGRLFKALQTALSVQEENSRSAEQLERQVRELAQIVRTQDSMLQQAVNKPQQRGRGSATPGTASASTASVWSGGRRGDETPQSVAWSEPSELSAHARQAAAMQYVAEQVTRALRAQNDFLAAFRVPPQPSGDICPVEDSV